MPEVSQNFILILLAGVPDRDLRYVRHEIRSTYYPHTADLIGHGARLRRDPSGFSYSEDYLDTLLTLTWNYVFQEQARPRGFCPNSGKNCANRYRGRKTCSKLPDQICRLSRPSGIALLYHRSQNINLLHSRFGIFTYKVELSQEVYNRPSKLLSTVTYFIRNFRHIKGEIYKEINSNAQSTPLLLPPINFNSNVVKALLCDISEKNDTRIHDKIKNFRKVCRREKMPNKSRCYVNDMNLAFKPADHNHGVASLRDDDKNHVADALSGYYRLGCPYNDAFHYDVQRVDGKNLDCEFYCWRTGCIRVRQDHVPVYPNDWVRTV